MVVELIPNLIITFAMIYSDPYLFDASAIYLCSVCVRMITR